VCVCVCVCDIAIFLPILLFVSLFEMALLQASLQI